MGSAASVVVAVCLVVSLALPTATPRHRTATGKTTVSRLVSGAALESFPQGSPSELAVEHAEQGFALALTQRLLSSAGNSNVVVSPESLGAVLTMLELGARGSTEQEIADALGAGHAAPVTQAAGWDALTARLQSDAALSGAQLTDENSVFVQRTVPVATGYLDVLKRYFDAGVERVDFSSAEAAKAVNTWVAGSTDGKVRRLFSAPLSSLTQLVLTDAVHFSARWARGLDFVPSVETSQQFVTASGARVSVTMMRLESALAFVSTSKLQAVVLPYAGQKFEAVLVKARSGSLTSLVAGLNSTELTKLTAAARTGAVNLTMPRFSISSEANLNGVLQAMGMAGAFGSRADFTGITSGLGIRVQAVAQADSLTVGPQGTDTSSASGAQSGPTDQRGRIETISFDRPFLFVIRDIATGAIVSDAIVADPSQS
jgi:serpin B